MTHLGRAIAALLLVSAWSTTAAGRGASQTCPPDANSLAGAVSIDVHLTNDECAARNVRLLSTFIGNTNTSVVSGSGVVSDIGVFGPRVLYTAPVPAASDQLPGTCTNNQCDGSSIYCESNADCVCRVTIPGTADFSLIAPLPSGTPGALDGTVMTHLLTADWQAPPEQDFDKCYIALPEPSSPVQLAAAVAMLVFLRYAADRRSRKHARRGLASR